MLLARARCTLNCTGLCDTTALVFTETETGNASAHKAGMGLLTSPTRYALRPVGRNTTRGVLMRPQMRARPASANNLSFVRRRKWTRAHQTRVFPLSSFARLRRFRLPKTPHTCPSVLLLTITPDIRPAGKNILRMLDRFLSSSQTLCASNAPRLWSAIRKYRRFLSRCTPHLSASQPGEKEGKYHRSGTV